jgi:anti-anti-sigma regulatory factor
MSGTHAHNPDPACPGQQGNAKAQRGADHPRGKKPCRLSPLDGELDLADIPALVLYLTVAAAPSGFVTADLASLEYISCGGLGLQIPAVQERTSKLRKHLVVLRRIELSIREVINSLMRLRRCQGAACAPTACRWRRAWA